MSNLTIRPFASEDIEDVARIHFQELPDDFLPSLGQDFLEEIFYPAVLSSQKTEGVVSWQNDEVNGFSIIALDKRGLMGEIIFRHLFKFIRIFIRFVFKRKDNLRKALQILSSDSFELEETHTSKLAEIYFIAVDEDFQNRGIGGKLVDASIQLARKKGLDGLAIKTLAKNESWVKFFIKRRWEKLGECQIGDQRYVYLGCRFRDFDEVKD